jgi:riboflavin kinase/FMN adenylyltransferase
MSFPDWESLSRSRPSAVALGNFDGVHLGHRRILEELLSESERRGLDPVALTFDPHPRVFFFPEKSTHLLTPPREKEGLLRAFGVEAITVNFNVGLAGLEAAEFAREILMGRLRGAAFFLGPGHRFGKKALGNSELLRDVLGGDSGQVREIAPVESMGEIISSSAIRHHLKAGQIPEANAMLGRPYALRGLVERGAERGRSLGFPTANLRLEDDRKALPAFGVYGGVARIGERDFPAIGNVGLRPTFGEKIPRIEVHVLGIDENLYGREIEFALQRFLRPEQAFSSPEALKRQISEDVANWENSLAG